MPSAVSSSNHAPPRTADASPRAPRIGGIVPFTTTDFPGRLAAVLFMQGCPWRCAYCHNPHLVPAWPDDGAREHDWHGVLRWLGTRRRLLDGVVFSGGEPTAQAAIVDAVLSVRSLGFETGLHTAGAYPRRLHSLLPHLDWVGLDVKAPRAGYEAVTGIAGSGIAAFESLELLLRSGLDHELRTTVHPVLTPAPALQILARELAARGVTSWVLQRFRASGCDDGEIVAAAPRGATIDAKVVEALRAYVPSISVR
jgi:pyruvate formate lyase activating enzyme